MSAQNWPADVKLVLNTWKPSQGPARRYINNLPDVLGLEVTYYKTGNISTATYQGEHIANAAAGRILGAKVWIDSAGKVHVDRWSESWVVDAEQVAERVQALFDTNAIYVEVAA